MSEHDVHYSAHHDAYDAWLEGKTCGTVPEGFAGRVMERVYAEPFAERTWWDRPWVLAGAWTAASVLLLVRLAGVVGVLLPS